MPTAPLSTISLQSSFLASPAARSTIAMRRFHAVHIHVDRDPAAAQEHILSPSHFIPSLGQTRCIRILLDCNADEGREANSKDNNAQRTKDDRNGVVHFERSGTDCGETAVGSERYAGARGREQDVDGHVILL